MRGEVRCYGNNSKETGEGLAIDNSNRDGVLAEGFRILS